MECFNKANCPNINRRLLQLITMIISYDRLNYSDGSNIVVPTQILSTLAAIGGKPKQIVVRVYRQSQLKLMGFVSNDDIDCNLQKHELNRCRWTLYLLVFCMEP